MCCARSEHVHVCVPASVHVSSYVHSLARTQAKKDCLFCARGCVKALRLMVEIFIRCAAARPRNKHGLVMKDSPPIFKLFREDNLLFQKEFFDSPAFNDLVTRVSQAEEREIGPENMEPVTEPTPGPGPGIGLSPITARIERTIGAHTDVPLKNIQRQLAFITDALAKGESSASITGGSAMSSAHIETDMSPAHKKKATGKGLHAAAAAKGVAAGEKGIELHVMSNQKTTIAQLWQEYTVGLNGCPSIKELNERHGTKWRSYYGGKQMYHMHSVVYEEIERRMKQGSTEAVAVAAVQDMMDAHTVHPESRKRGRQHSQFPLHKLAATLQKLHPRRRTHDSSTPVRNVCATWCVSASVRACLRASERASEKSAVSVMYEPCRSRSWQHHQPRDFIHLRRRRRRRLQGVGVQRRRRTRRPRPSARPPRGAVARSDRQHVCVRVRASMSSGAPLFVCVPVCTRGRA